MSLIQLGWIKWKGQLLHCNIFTERKFGDLEKENEFAGPVQRDQKIKPA
jgi:hypothetical protein